MGSISRGKAHLLVIPFPTQGHITPMLRLAIELAQKSVAITFASYETEISLLMKGSENELRSLDFEFVTLNDNIDPDGKINPLPSTVSEKLKKAFKPYMEELVRDKLSGMTGPGSVLSDMYLTWTQDIAAELQIPRYMFVPSGVTLARYIQGSLELYRRGQLQASKTDGKLVEFDGSVSIPGIPPLSHHELNIVTRVDPVHDLARSETIWKAAGVLVNSFYELEEKIVAAWRRPGNPGLGFDQTKVPEIYPVGPLIDTEATITVVQGLEFSVQRSIEWLDSQPASSVLYIAFGTHVRLSPGPINTLARALESCKQRFLWVLPQSDISSDPNPQKAPSISNLLPPNFEKIIGDGGCIVSGWAPQMRILAHPSTGGFLTHAGWNSILESITTGVAMVVWPHGSEQHLNCRYLVDDLKIAEEILTGLDNILEQKEAERVVRLVMGESARVKEMRSRVQQLQKKAAEAMAEGGSRLRAVQQFVDDLLN